MSAGLEDLGPSPGQPRPKGREPEEDEGLCSSGGSTHEGEGGSPVVLRPPRLLGIHLSNGGGGEKDSGLDIPLSNCTCKL